MNQDKSSTGSCGQSGFLCGSDDKTQLDPHDRGLTDSYYKKKCSHLILKSFTEIF